jgi:CRISPR/Cas system-associated exonuclease Cas4 (RecB family)
MRHDEMVSASELGEYVYCRRAWWLRRVMGIVPSDAARQTMDAGEVWHKEQWKTMEHQRQSHSIRYWAAWTALATAAVLLLLWWWRR